LNVFLFLFVTDKLGSLKVYPTNYTHSESAWCRECFSA